MTAVDIALFSGRGLATTGHYVDSTKRTFSALFTKPSETLMNLDPQREYYPLFLDPDSSYQASNDKPEDRNREWRNAHPGPLDSNPTKCIIDRIRTIKLDTPALRRTHLAFQQASRSPSPARGRTRDARPATGAEERDFQTGERSAYAITTARIQQMNKSLSRSAHARVDSLQQRRQPHDTDGGLTISSPTARQGGGRPAGPMIWLPDEQVWLLADSTAPAVTTSSGVVYPSSAPMREVLRSEGTDRGRGQDGEDRHRHRSDSSPIRSQFMRLMIQENEDTSFSAQDWTRTHATTGPSASEEDAIWHAEQLARVRKRRDQDRFNPMLQQALVGVDLYMDSDPAPQYLAVPADRSSHKATGMLWSLAGDMDNIGSVLAASSTGPHLQQAPRTIAERRSASSLRSRISAIGTDDFDLHAAASLHVQQLEGTSTTRRRHSADDNTGRGPADPDDVCEHDWLAGLIAQDMIPEGLLYSPAGSVMAQGSEDCYATSSTRASSGARPSVEDGHSPVRWSAAISPVSAAGQGQLSRSATTAGDGRGWQQQYQHQSRQRSQLHNQRDEQQPGRMFSVSSAGGDTRYSPKERNPGDVSPMSSGGMNGYWD